MRLIYVFFKLTSTKPQAEKLGYYVLFLFNNYFYLFCILFLLSFYCYYYYIIYR